MPFDPKQANKYAEERKKRIAEAREKAKAVDDSGKSKKAAAKSKSKAQKPQKHRGQDVGPPEGGWDTSPFGSHKNDRMINSIVIFGESGGGKSMIAGSFPGDKYGLSFDNKLEPIAQKYRDLYPDERFEVRNGARYYPPHMDDDEVTMGGHRTYEYLLHLIETEVVGRGYKWGIMDSSDIFLKAMEHGMRWEEGFGPFAGMGKDNWSVWGRRNMMVKKIINALADAVEYGVIITAYYAFDMGLSDDYQEPSWPNALRELVKVELHALKDVERGRGDVTIDHYAENMQSKDEDLLRTGDVYNMHTNELRWAVAEALGEETSEDWFEYDERGRLVLGEEEE